MRLRGNSIREIIRVKDGLRDVGIEGEKIGLASKKLGSPSMASLDMPSLNSF
jgi:hypothetical protein